MEASHFWPQKGVEMIARMTAIETEQGFSEGHRPFASRLCLVFGRVMVVGSSWLLLAAVATAQSSPTFDHDFTRFPLTGKHEQVTCESCHVDGQFEGTPFQCHSCHGGLGARGETRRSISHIPIQTECNDCHVTRFWEPARMDHGSVGENCVTCHIGQIATSKPIGHIQSSNRCGDCHGTGRWEGARFDHASVTANCFSCHNGLTATGKNTGHIVSGNDCEVCHSTRAWTPATFDHSAITTNCVSCHNGSTATGKGNNHIPAGNDCELCHSTQRWSPATNFDHSGVTANCFSCHNGSIAMGKNVGHVQSSNDCELCHMTNGWIPAGFDHMAVIPGTCNSCHNGMIAPGTPGGHFSSTLSCDSCHGTQNWLPASFDHAGAAYPGDHGVRLDCIDCHGGNSQLVTWSSPAYQPDCAGCHANDFRVGGPHKTATVSELRDCAGACHKPSEHSVSKRDW